MEMNWQMPVTDCWLVGFYKVVQETDLEAAGKMFCRKVPLLL